MLIKTKNIVCETREIFNTLKLPSGPSDTNADILWSSTVYIENTAEIWSHGKLFGGLFSNADENKVSLSIGGVTKILSLHGHTQPYTTLTGSTEVANQAILSSGTANGWMLKTLGKNAFSNVDYLPADATAVAAEKVVNPFVFSVKSNPISEFDGSSRQEVNLVEGDNVYFTTDAGNVTISAEKGEDTVNTAGALNKVDTKMFLIGAQTQTAAPQTYSNQYVYIGSNNRLYSGGKEVLTDHQPIYNLDLQTQIDGTVTKVITFDPNSANNSFTLVQGTNVTLTPDITNKKVTISSKDTTYNFYDLVFKQGTTVVDAYKPTTSPSKSLKAGTNVTFSKNENEITITSQDTKTTTGATEKLATKLFLTGSLAQTDNPQTYTNSKVYIGTDNKLYSDGKVVSTGDHTHNYVSKSGDTMTGPLVISHTIVKDNPYTYLDLKSPSGWSNYLNTHANITFSDASGRVAAIGCGYDSVGYIDFHSMYNGGYRNDSDVIMRIKGNGNVGIGTVSPIYKLHVNGAISGTKLHVDENNYISTVGNYLSLRSRGNELCIGGANDLYINYRAPEGGTPKTWKWMAGSSTSYADFELNTVNLKAPSGTAPIKVVSNTVCSNLNADLLDGLHAGIVNNSIAKYVNFPGWSTLVSQGYLTSDYESQGHPTNLYLQALCKWAIANHKGTGGVILQGLISPNSQGYCVIELYAHSGFDSSTKLPRYCSGLYNDLGGSTWKFGCNNYVWYEAGTFKGTATSATSASSATKLANARNLWGRPFDGTANVSGDMTGVGSITMSGSIVMNNSQKIIGKHTDGTNMELFYTNTSNSLVIGTGNALKGGSTYISGNSLVFRTSTGTSERMTIDSTGRVGIGTGSPTEKLQVVGNGLFGGDLLLTQSSDTGTRQVRMQCGTNDYGRIAAGATASNAGWVELASADDGNEPIYVRQYTGVFTTIKRTLTLLDASGNSSFPGNVSMSGNASAANFNTAGKFTSSFNSNSWINSVTNSALTVNNTGYSGIWCAAVKDGRVVMSTYPSSNNNVYLGYATTAQITAGTNSLNKQTYWNASNGFWTSDGYVKSGSSDSYMLLGGGGHSALSNYFRYAGEHNSNASDWNSVTSTGNLRISKATISNGPSGAYNYGQLLTFNAGGTLSQMYLPHNASGSMYIRTGWSGVSQYYGWVQVVTTGNYTTLLDSRYVNTAGDTMTGALKFNMATPYIRMTPTNNVQGSGSYLQFDSTDKQNVRIRHEWFDGVKAGYGLIIEKGADNTGTADCYLYLKEGSLYVQSKIVAHTGYIYSEKGWFQNNTVGTGLYNSAKDARWYAHNDGYWYADKAIKTNNRFISTVATGTKPIEVTSTTLCNNLNADLLDGQQGDYYRRCQGKHNYISITVGGNATTWYPVVITGATEHYPATLLNITRGYNDTAPDSWNTSTHKGGLTLCILWNESRYWDGNGGGGDGYANVIMFKETYCQMVNGLDTSTQGLVVWLRGGSAVYRIFSNGGLNLSATVHTSAFTDSANRTFSLKSAPTVVNGVNTSLQSRQKLDVTVASASKIGTSTIGGTSKPIYLNSGTPTACSSTVGSSTVPVYMNGGTITQCTASSVFSALSSNSSTNLSITVAGQNRTIGSLYAYRAAGLTTSRSIWGQSFNGTGNVSGALTGVTTISMDGGISNCTGVKDDRVSSASFEIARRFGGSNYTKMTFSTTTSNNGGFAINTNWQAANGAIQIAGDINRGTGRLWLGYSTSRSVACVETNNRFYAASLYAGGSQVTSDIRLKNRISSLSCNMWEKLKHITPFYYTKKGEEENGVRLGVSANEVRYAFPELTELNQCLENKYCQHYYTVDYGALGAVVAINGYKELRNLIEARTKKLNKLELRIAKLTRKVRDLSRIVNSYHSQ